MIRPSSRLLIRLTGALAALGFGWALALVLFGGFDLTIGGITFTSTDPARPGYAGAVFAAIHLWFTGLAPWRRRLVRLREHLQRRWLTPDRLALALTAAFFVLCFVHRSTTAAGSDVYGYLSQADRWLMGDLHIEQPWVDQVPWNNARWSFADLGYRPMGEAGNRHLVPAYSSGLPLLMAAAKLAGGHAAMFVVVPLTGAITVWVTYWIGRRIATPHVGLVAAVLVATSPPFLLHAVLPMSDVPAAAFWTVATAGVVAGSLPAAAMAGLAAGIAILIRPNLVYLAAVLGAWIVADGWRRRPHAGGAARRGALYSFGVIAGSLAVAAINAHLYGSPAESGYGNLDQFFARTNVLPNLARYPWWLAETSPLGLVGLLALLWPAARIWPSDEARRFAMLGAGFTASLWILYVFYLVFEDWSYLRFLMPSWPFMMIGTAVVLRALVARRSRAWTIGVAIVTAGFVIAQLGFADRDIAFEIGQSERHYAGAALAVEAATPPEAVVLALQHSGTVQYYGGRTALRYDALDGDALDEAVAWLTARGLPVYAMLPDYDVERFQTMFQGETLAAQLRQREVMRYRGTSAISLFSLSPPIPLERNLLVVLPIPEGTFVQPSPTPRPPLRLPTAQ